ncbi:glycoside hydrolase family 32 protein [Holdemania massiliensis]|uniref:Sucrose-6-phosphate hydrolase n=1 Tax=Holdemania massiliensis TaxID=1468449 RepID=A0A6N7S5M8_9FIRM|nr:glycoside hydrolase family 32 protein [Holdemania massiliensis]MSA70732.1 sucrose-6-phosphate hydrolase [Holdemania massiliensis]MSA88982.1 sucrose-6-phosphate hydrolase [Holdemania massiliensis]MSB77811.1 sucrose-6-phosphate hydrolase [Holdemania massiliensis]MSC32736.1 sucrose-6-phosphate hydrolase [Holdemania massiliensis]MSC39057.1 sucrose-6-phosphate hydrolase [Holdemania massiliensis]
MNDYRLTSHLAPKRGWLNDPNGLCVHQGVIHIFYQADPDSLTGKRKAWGHFTTTDFVHYTDCGLAIEPTEAFERHGAYSGSALSVGDQLHLFYTGNVKEPGDHDFIRSGRQHNTIHALSNGKTVDHKHVVLSNADYPDFCSCHVRDPKVNKIAEGYEMVLGARTLDDEGCVLRYTSMDLEHWQLNAVLRSQNKMGYMWECPDLLHFDDVDVLLCCPQGLTRQGYHYENVYDNGYFLIQQDQAKTYRTLDYGFDFYAPQTFEDSRGRRILIGWMGLPDTDYTIPTKTWMHALTLPRQLRYEEGQLKQRVIDELQPTHLLTAKTTQAQAPQACVLKMQPQKSLTLAIDTLKIQYADGLFTLDCSACGEGRTQRHVELPNLDTLELYLDVSSVEIFLNDGQFSLTSRCFFDTAIRTIQADCEFDLYDAMAIEIESRDIQ